MHVLTFGSMYVCDEVAHAPRLSWDKANSALNYVPLSDTNALIGSYASLSPMSTPAASKIRSSPRTHTSPQSRQTHVKLGPCNFENLTEKTWNRTHDL